MYSECLIKTKVDAQKPLCLQMYRDDRPINLYGRIKQLTMTEANSLLKIT